MKTHPSCPRIGLAVAAGVMAWSAATAALVSSVRVTLPAALDGAATLDDCLATLAALVALGVLGWLAVAIGTATLAELLPAGGRAAHRVRSLAIAITPAAARRVLAVLVTGVLFTGAGPAAAAPATAPAPAATSAGWDSDVGPTLSPTLSPTVGPTLSPTVGPTVGHGIGPALDPAWLPDTRSRPADLDPSWGTPGRLRARSYPNESVVVRRGDTLWDIAARHLGGSATDAEIALSWPRWFAANRATIGPDPDRLVPGQRLYPPLPRAGGTS